MIKCTCPWSLYWEDLEKYESLWLKYKAKVVTPYIQILSVWLRSDEETSIIFTENIYMNVYITQNISLVSAFCESDARLFIRITSGKNLGLRTSVWGLCKQQNAVSLQKVPPHTYILETIW
jgi:hypothetical protein